LRIFAAHRPDPRTETEAAVALAREEAADGFRTLARYRPFAARVEETKRALLAFLIEARRAGKTVVGYGAPGKGNTLLNYCGIRPDLLAYTADRNPYKHGRYTPGTRLPIHPPDRIDADRPAPVLALPRNLRPEISAQPAGAAPDR